MNPIHVASKWFSLVLVSAFVISCNSDKGKEISGSSAVIEGEIKNLPAEAKILLSRIDVKGPEAVDSATADKEGRFNLESEADDERLYILSVGEQRVPVFLEKGIHKLTADFNQLYNSTVYTNSPLTTLMRKVEGIRQSFDLEAKSLQYDYEEAMQRGNKTKGDSILKVYEGLQVRSKSTIKSFIDSVGPSPVTHLATSMLSLDEDFAFLDSLGMRFEKEKPNAVFTKKMNAFLEAPRKFGVGKDAPVFTQNDPNGKPLSLDKFKGKWVLIDFWASWCKPCRAENPNVVNAFNKFKAKGFQILSVSLDSEKAPWMKAIVADRLFWAHVSDLKGWDNDAAKLYGVSSIPASFLIDPQGKIAAKNLRGEALEKKLSEVMP